jgi:diguanylate cyclase (GGDEF)-like protein
MTPTMPPMLEASREDRAQEIRLGLRRLERRGWSLWGSATIIMLSLFAAIASLTASATGLQGDPFFDLHMSQSVRGLLGLVLLFNVYTVYQQVHLRRVRGHLTNQIEISAQEHDRAQEFLRLAMVDPLTGLHNRRFAEERLTAEMSRSQRNGQPLTVVMLDLDNFKYLNDHYGHRAGDFALRAFADRVTSAIRGSDLATRIGGDEFVVLLPECAPGQVQAVLQRLRHQEINLEGEQIPVCFSAGWADYQAGESSAQLLERADQALYAEKRMHQSGVAT